MKDAATHETPTWLAKLTPVQMAWRDQEIGEGRDPDPYIRAEIGGAGQYAGERATKSNS